MTTQSISLIPQLHKPFTDPKIRFALYDAPTTAEVERSAHTATAIRGFFTAYNRRPLLEDAGAHEIPGMPAPFGGHPRARQQALPKSLHNIAHPGEASAGARPFDSHIARRRHHPRPRHTRRRIPPAPQTTRRHAQAPRPGARVSARARGRARPRPRLPPRQANNIILTDSMWSGPL